MTDDTWELDLSDGFGEDLDGGLFDEPDGPGCFERTCQGCGKPFLVNLYFQSHVSDHSPLSRCDDCLQAMIAAGKRRVLKRCGPYNKSR